MKSLQGAKKSTKTTSFDSKKPLNWSPTNSVTGFCSILAETKRRGRAESKSWEREQGDNFIVSLTLGTRGDRVMQRHYLINYTRNVLIGQGSSLIIIMDSAVSRLLSFLDASPTPYHAVSNLGRLLEAKGFIHLRESQADWSVQPGGRYWFTRNGSALVAFAIGKNFVKYK